MALPIEDYALIGDRKTAALVGIDGSIDWMCIPHFDSHACFAAILGTHENGRWLIGPLGEATTTRRYLAGSLILETTHHTDTGTVTVVDTMPSNDERADIVRTVRGIEGEVQLKHELIVRFGYGETKPWMRRIRAHGETVLQAVAGPDRLVLRGPLPKAVDGAHRAVVTVREGERIDFTLGWQPSHTSIAAPLDVDAEVSRTLTDARAWLDNISYDGPYIDAVRTSALLLHHLTDAQTGGIIAAPTTSLPEALGGERNWDYRYTWLRDASLTVEAVLAVGLQERSAPWRDWLLRAVAGDVTKMLIMYRRDGGREMAERTLDHLTGYRGSRPVRVGNDAWSQRQHDVLGQLMLTLEKLRKRGIKDSMDSWHLQRALLNDLAEHWHLPDRGLWEIRGEPKMFTHSRAMMWAAFDCGIRAVEGGLDGPIGAWIDIREALREEVLSAGFDEGSGSFRQHYDTDDVDAALLQLATIGIVEPDDPRFIGTVERIERELMVGGMPLRYRTTAEGEERNDDGLRGDEHPFVLCGFWLVIARAQIGRLDDARALMHQLIAARNDVGLLAEELDPISGAHLGNFPQAFSHLGLMLAADAIAQASAA